MGGQHFLGWAKNVYRVKERGPEFSLEFKKGVQIFFCASHQYICVYKETSVYFSHF